MDGLKQSFIRIPDDKCNIVYGIALVLGTGTLLGYNLLVSCFDYFSVVCSLNDILIDVIIKLMWNNISMHIILTFSVLCGCSDQENFNVNNIIAQKLCVCPCRYRLL